MNARNLSDTGAWVLSGGAATSVGSTLPASAAAVRAGIAMFNHHPNMVDGAGRPMVVGAAPYLPRELEGAERLLALAGPAACEALAVLPFKRMPMGPQVDVFVGLPEPRPGLEAGTLRAFIIAFERALRQVLPVSGVHGFMRGHCAGLLALQAGIEKLHSGAALCLVGGVDSALDPLTLEWIESCGQLHGAGDDNNAWGYVPGEGAGFCLVGTGEAANRLGIAPRAGIAALGAAREQCLIKTDTVCTGAGLTRAFQAAFGQLGASQHRIDHVLCDMNGEPYRAEEYAFATLRTHDRFVDSADFVAPADCWGDVGAASGPLFIGLALEAHAKGYRPGRRTLVWTSSEGGDRIAAVVDFARR
jgi:3-oxoacyl-[acyl-carrier-protein] synthase-1